jgi:hypothetical protein
MGCYSDGLHRGAQMSKPKVLVFIDWYLPGYKAGGPVRSLANLVDHLRDRIDFHIVTRNTEYTESAPYPGIQPDTWTELAGGEKVWYTSEVGTSRNVWKQILKEQNWDSVYINGLYSWWYNILPLWLSRSMKVRRIVAVRGMLASGAMQHGALKKLLFLSFARMVDLYKGVHFQATNEEEAKDVRLHIDLKRMPKFPSYRICRARSRLPQCRSRAKEMGAVKLVSVARIAVEKNTLFAIESLRERDRSTGAIQSVTARSTMNPTGPKCQEAIAALPAEVKVSMEEHGYRSEASAEDLGCAPRALHAQPGREFWAHHGWRRWPPGCPCSSAIARRGADWKRARAGWDLPWRMEQPGDSRSLWNWSPWIKRTLATWT